MSERGGSPGMERVTFRVPKGLLEDVEKRVDRGEFANRSEAIRAGMRELVDERDARRRLVADGGTVEDGMDRFRCEDCGMVNDPPGHSKCDECGGLVREYLPMEAPVYQVEVGGMGRIWFPADEYSGAFQHATGTTVDEVGADHEQEAEITILDFDGVAEVPVANV